MFGPFELMYQIAHGGISEVHRAKYRNQTDAPDVLLKRLKSPYNADKRFISMLVDEAQIMNRINHPNITRVYEFGEVNGRHYLALEFVDGVSMAELLKRLRRLDSFLPVDVALYIAVQALRGLHHVHRQPEQVVHRDFNPSNIMLGYDGMVKLIDFGIAKSEMRKTRTRGGVIKGKLRYMSPEQTRGEQVNRRSDIFSAGATLYELFSMTKAFEGSSDAEIIQSVRSADVRPLSFHNAGFDHQMDLCVARALWKDPDGRYRSAEDFADCLLEWALVNDCALAQENAMLCVNELFASERAEQERRRQDYEAYAHSNISTTSFEASEFTRIVGTGYHHGTLT